MDSEHPLKSFPNISFHIQKQPLFEGIWQILLQMLDCTDTKSLQNTNPFKTLCINEVFTASAHIHTFYIQPQPDVLQSLHAH